MLTKQARIHSRGQDLTVAGFQIFPYPKEPDCLPLYSKLRQCGLSKLIEGIQASRSIFSFSQIPMCLFILTPSCPAQRESLCKAHYMSHFERTWMPLWTSSWLKSSVPRRQRKQQPVGKHKKSCYLYVKLNSGLLNILANLCHNYFGPFRHPKAFCGQNAPPCCCLTVCASRLLCQSQVTPFLLWVVG